MPPKSDNTESIVLNFVNEQNRPLNTQNVADALQKYNLKKTAVQKALDALADGGKISFKEYGKQKIYIARQDQFEIPNSEELTRMKEENANLQEQLNEQKRAVNEVEAEIKTLQSNLTLEEIQAKEERLSTEAEEMEERLVKLREGVTLVRPEERKAIQELYAQAMNHWRKRKRMFKDLWDAITENSPKDVKEFMDQELVPFALSKSKQVKGFSARWKMIVSKIEQLPTRLSDLSCHPCFSKNTLCIEQLQSVVKTLKEAIHLADLCIQEKYEGKLRMQSDLDSLSGKLDLNLHDCGLLIKTGVLSEVATAPSTSSSSSCSFLSCEPENIRELLARLQIGHLESKHRALDSLVEIMKEDEKTVLSSLGRSNIAALVSLLTATNARIREKTVTVICSLAESGSCESWLVSEGILPPLIRLVESGSPVSKEKAAISLQRLSMNPETARAVVGHGGVGPLVDVCRTGDSVSQAAAACTLKNISAVPEARQSLADEGAIKVMIDLLDCGLLLGSKEYAAECLQNLTSSNESFRRMVVEQGGIRSLLVYLDGPLPQESAVGAIRNLVGSVSVEVLDSLGFLPRLVHVLQSGSVGAQQAAASAVCKVCTSTETKRMVGEAGCVTLLVKMLEAKSNGAREVAAQALSVLMTVPQNQREVKKDDKSVPSLVQLLDPSQNNTAKKYAATCLAGLSSSKKCKKLMISYGAIGYLKKLTEMEIPGAKKLLERLERGKLRSLFSRK